MQDIPLDLSAEILRRYSELIVRRRAATLSPAEYAELLRLTEQVEEAEVRRVESLIALAREQQIDLSTLMDGLRRGPGGS